MLARETLPYLNGNKVLFVLFIVPSGNIQTSSLLFNAVSAKLIDSGLFCFLLTGITPAFKNNFFNTGLNSSCFAKNLMFLFVEDITNKASKLEV